MHRWIIRVLLVAGAVVAVAVGSMSSAFADGGTLSPPNAKSMTAQAPDAPSVSKVLAIALPATAASSPPPTTTSANQSRATTSTPVHAADVQPADLHSASVLPSIVVDPKVANPQPPAGSGSTGRVGSGFAATPDGTQAVLYGGGDVFNNGASLGDTWVWNGTTWTPKCGTSSPGATTPCAPGPRDLVAEATGPTGVVLYGGQTSDGMGNATLHGDSYLWDGNAWQQICASCAPGPRAAAAMAGNGRIVLLFGGGDTSGNALPLGDTWELNGSTWTLASPGGAGQPAARIGASMAWDGQHFVLFGGLIPDNGSGNQTALADTWIWTGTQWVQGCGDPLAACGPAPRVLGGLASLTSPDPAQRGALLVGGLGFPNGTNASPDILGDIWFWNGSTWAKQASPWPDATSLDHGFPAGLPFVGVLAALPATCRTALAADILVDNGGTPTPTPGTWNIGFDTNGDGTPGPCPTTPPPPVTPVATSPTPAAAPATGTLPMTGTNPATDATVGAALLAAGLALTRASRRRFPRTLARDFS